MKIAIVSESSADDAVYRLLVDSLTGRKNDFVSSGRQRPGGWIAAINATEVEFRHLHFHTNAHALIVVIDSNGSTVHDDTHDTAPNVDCRICKINEKLVRVRGSLPHRHVNYPVQPIFGLAVPCKEAWLLCDESKPHITEARFERDNATGTDLSMERRQLKQLLYGTVTPSRALQTEIGIREAARLAADLSRLERSFPKGFGRFAQSIRAL